jgi:hypothetical protein
MLFAPTVVDGSKLLSDILRTEHRLRQGTGTAIYVAEITKSEQLTLHLSMPALTDRSNMMAAEFTP